MTLDRSLLLDQLDGLISLGEVARQISPDRYVHVANSLRIAARMYQIAAEAERKELGVLLDDISK